MKKRLMGVLLFIILVLTPIISYGADTEIEGETEIETKAGGSEFENILLKKGTLISKEFIDYGTIDGLNTSSSDDEITLSLETAKLTDLVTEREVYALRLEYFYINSSYDYGTVTGVLDLDEINDVITTLEYVKEHQEEFVDYTEVIYTANSGLVIGAYKAAKTVVFIKFNSSDTVYVDFESIDTIIDTLKGAQEVLDSYKK